MAMEEIEDTVTARAEALFAAVLAGACYADFYGRDKKKDSVTAREKRRIFVRNGNAVKRQFYLDAVNKKSRRHGCPLRLAKPHNYGRFLEGLRGELDEALAGDGLRYEFWLGQEHGCIPRRLEQAGARADDFFALLATCVYELRAASDYTRDALAEIARALGVRDYEKLLLATARRLRRRRSAGAALLCVLGLVLAAGGYFTYKSFTYYIEEKSFKSFDLQSLARKDFIFQSIEFKKFLVYGTEGGSEYTDELQIYYVSGTATVGFGGIDRLSIDTDRSDYARKILRLNYAPDASRPLPFDIDILIQEKDIYPVADYESKKFLGVFDLVPRDRGGADIVRRAKEQLRKEFEGQVLADTAAGNLADSDVYQAFLKKFTEMVRNSSDWETVEIDFGRGR